MFSLAGKFPGMRHFHWGFILKGQHLKLVQVATVTTRDWAKQETMQMYKLRQRDVFIP